MAIKAAKSSKTTKTTKTEKTPSTDKTKEVKSDIVSAPKGDVRSQTVKLGPTSVMNAAQIAPTSTYNAAQVTRARDVGIPTLGGAAQMGQTVIDRTQEAQTRAQQLSYAQALAAQAQGQGPSVAGIAMQEGTNRAVAQQMGTIAAQRLRNPANAARLAAIQGAALQQQGVLDASKLKMAEAIAAQQQYGQTITDMRTADASIAAQQAQLNQNVESSNQAAINARQALIAENQMKAQAANQQADLNVNQYQAQLEQQARSEAAAAENTTATNQAQLEQQAIANNQAAINAANQNQAAVSSDVLRTKISGEFGKEGSRISAAGNVNAAAASAAGQVRSQEVAQEGANYRNDSQLAVGLGQSVADSNQAYDRGVTSANQAASNRQAGVIGTGISAAATIAASDERVKKNISPADKEIDVFLEKMNPEHFEYKDPKKFGEGKRVGVMAQDVEKSEAGKTMITKDASGTRFLDFQKGLGMLLAASARLNDRLSKLEGKR